jgi:hypothetical protein
MELLGQNALAGELSGQFAAGHGGAKPLAKALELVAEPFRFRGNFRFVIGSVPGRSIVVVFSPMFHGKSPRVNRADKTRPIEPKKERAAPKSCSGKP